MELKDLINSEDFKIYQDLSIYATQLGYKHQRAKTKDIIHLFVDPHTKERVLKFSYSNKDGFAVSLKFHKTSNYSDYFKNAIQKTIEEYNFKYTGCYDYCNKCDGTKGYIYTYPDQTTYFRCYQELIDLPNLSYEQMKETKELLWNQMKI